MFEQIITERDVRQLIHKHELINEKENRKLSKDDDVIKNIFFNIDSGKYKFKITQTSVEDKTLYSADNIETRIILRYLDRLIKRVYKVRQTNRDRIIKQLISMLHSNNEFYICKLDISSFYETINTTKLLQHIKDDGIISFKNYSLINSVIKKKTCKKGLPRGISFSAALSEFYLRSFDKYLKRHSKITYFARYVDDIIIISSVDISQEIKDYIRTNLGLEINIEKEKEYKIDNSNNKIFEINFLGYTFLIHNQKANKRIVEVKIETSKIEKIKKRIIKSSLIFIKDGKFNNYYDRIRLLFSNYMLDKNKNGILMSGIYYNYRYITDYSSLNKVNQFKNSLISNNSRLSKKINSKLSLDQKQKLFKINIYDGFHKKMKVKLTSKRITDLFKDLKYV